MIKSDELERLVEAALRRVLENLGGEDRALLGQIAAQAINENRQAQGKPALEL